VKFYSLLAAELSKGYLGDCLLQQHTLSSDGLVGVEHDSNKATLSVTGHVLSERNTDSTGGTMGVDNLTPGASVASVVLVILYLVDIGNALAEVPLSGGLILAVFNMNQCLI
jgi:hypothetical protein